MIRLGPLLSLKLWSLVMCTSFTPAYLPSQAVCIKVVKCEFCEVLGVLCAIYHSRLASRLCHLSFEVSFFFLVDHQWTDYFPYFPIWGPYNRLLYHHKAPEQQS